MSSPQEREIKLPPHEQADAIQKSVGILSNPPSVVFSLKGESARRWCNGMFSNNIRKLQSGQGNMSAICSDRGFVSNLIHCFCLSDTEFIAVLERESIDSFMNKFEMYLVLDDIEVETWDTAALTIMGPDADKVVESLGFTPPEQDVSNLNSLTLIRINRGIDSIDIYGSTDEIKKLLQKATRMGIPQIDRDGFELLRIREGRARSPQDISNKTLIHNLGLNERCCAFDKGCYVGQETINRIDVKGLNNKLLHRFSITGEASPGEDIKLNNQTVGQLSSVAKDKDGLVGLGIIRKKGWGASSFHTEKGAILHNLDQ